MSKITTQNIQDMLASAGYGIAYWAISPTDEQWVEGKTKGAVAVITPHPEYVDGPVAKGSDAVVAPVYYLTESQLKAAFWKLAKNTEHLVNAEIHGYFKNAVKEATPEDGVDTGWIDADAADCLIQVAAFGKVVFG